MLAISGTEAGITDLNCTDAVAGVYKFAESAVNCRNKISDANCQLIYGNGVTVGTDHPNRDDKCAGNPPGGVTVKSYLVQIPRIMDSISGPRYPCSSVTQDMCESKAWRSILEEDCPKTCGLCDSGTCVDEAPGCSLDNAVICQSVNLQSFVRKYCKKTCGYCDTASTAVPSGECGSNPNEDMLPIILFSTLFVIETEAAITDLNCTHRVGADIKYAESAVNCRNKMSDANCQLIYGNAVKANTNDADRNEKCAGNPVNPQLLHTAISICPKQCGYCCLTPAFNCQNKLRPRYPCSSVTQDMCESNAWRDILAEDCPKTCGLCDSGLSFLCARH
ncbi:unnamed protein product [Haemonchus placei]|uniref:ShTK domain protein n=1 Tax=Haemonchus placei TaxID=6290 RepID=A0A0N4WPP2_HAEPC|nr:unnamed protein product [Haemonchus placei]